LNKAWITELMTLDCEKKKKKWGKAQYSWGPIIILLLTYPKTTTEG
jgi:hypothetical protein